MDAGLGAHFDVRGSNLHEVAMVVEVVGFGMGDRGFFWGGEASGSGALEWDSLCEYGGGGEVGGGGLRG